MMCIIPFPIGKAEFPRASSFPKAMSHIIFAKNKQATMINIQYSSTLYLFTS